MNANITTLPHILLNNMAKEPTRNIIGHIEEKKIYYYTRQEYKNTIKLMTLGLLSKGIKDLSKVCILANTSKEWHLYDISVLCTGSIVIPIYPTLSTEDIIYIIQHSEATTLIIENETLLKKITNDIQKTCIKNIISIKDISDITKNQLKSHYDILSHTELLNLGKETFNSTSETFENHIQQISPQSTATIIYTSGTTGVPKGAVITHQAIVSMLDNISNFTHDTLTNEDTLLTFLPLSHVFGRCESFLPIMLGVKTVYAESIDKLFDNINTVKPTLLCAVPRVIEKMYENIINVIDETSIVTKKVFDWANEIGDKYFEYIDNDRTPHASLILQYQMAQKIVFKKIYEKFGGQFRYFISGGAPLAAHLIPFFRNFGITILEGYGLTETIAPCVLNPLSKQYPGTVGRPLKNVEIKFATDGEILIKTTAMFSEYYKEEALTQDALKDGFFHTGDIGHFTAQGFLKITGRKKDIIITSGGKNIAPQKIELLLTKSPLIENAVIYGDKRKYLVALIGISVQASNKALEFTENISLSYQDLIQRKDLKALVQSEIDKINENLANFETIKKFIFIPEELSTKNYLTPSLKIKKKPLIDDLKAQIDLLYKD